MEIRHLHGWDVTPKEAIALQQELRQQVRLQADLGVVRRVAGVDVGFKGERARAAVVILSFLAVGVLAERKNQI